MPKFEVVSEISYGKRNDKGEVESQTYAPGSTIELTEDEARSVSHAIKKAPRAKVDSDMQEVIDSQERRPKHPEVEKARVEAEKKTGVKPNPGTPVEAANPAPGTTGTLTAGKASGEAGATPVKS